MNIENHYEKERRLPAVPLPEGDAETANRHYLVIEDVLCDVTRALASVIATEHDTESASYLNDLRQRVTRAAGNLRQLSEFAAASSPPEPTPPNLRRMLELATTRLGILSNRMEGCGDGNAHVVSLEEIPAWIQEQEAALAPQDAAEVDADVEHLRDRITDLERAVRYESDVASQAIAGMEAAYAKLAALRGRIKGLRDMRVEGEHDPGGSPTEFISRAAVLATLEGS